MTATVGRICELARYPVKSMQGERLDAAEVTGHGVVGDRTHAVRDVATGKVASAKQPKPWAALLGCSARVEDGVRVTLPGAAEHAVDDGALGAALAQLVDREVEVASAGPEPLGSYNSEWPSIPGVDLEGQHELPVALATEAVSFVDLAAIHLLTTSSLRRLEQLAHGTTMDPRRFRPNLLIDTGDEEGFVEDGWMGRTVQVGEAVLQITLRTPRCVMTTLAQPELTREPAVLRAAATNRHDVGGVGTFACTGVYAEVVTPGAVRLDDPVVLR